MATLHAVRGDDLKIVATCRGPRDVDGNPGPVINLTGYTVKFVVKVNGVETVYDSSPDVVVTPNLGKIEIHIEDAVTTDWLASGSFRFELTDTNGIKNTTKGVLEVR